MCVWVVCNRNGCACVGPAQLSRAHKQCGSSPCNRGGNLGQGGGVCPVQLGPGGGELGLPARNVQCGWGTCGKCTNSNVVGSLWGMAQWEGVNRQPVVWWEMGNH